MNFRRPIAKRLVSWVTRHEQDYLSMPYLVLGLLPTSGPHGIFRAQKIHDPIKLFLRGNTQPVCRKRLRTRDPKK